ncbi:MAG: DUF5947 family protein, partial [Caulobacteraceae bacterium]
FASPLVERCAFCLRRVGGDRPHLVAPAGRRVHCACEACAGAGPAARDYYRVQPRQARLADFALTDAEWAAFQIPIDLAFVFTLRGEAAPLALYPGPAGATEAWLSAEAWRGLTAKNPVLADLAPDIEALLINRTQGRRDYYRVSADHCYALVGLMRSHWRGLSGGEEAWAAIDGYFERLASAAGLAPLHA